MYIYNEKMYDICNIVFQRTMNPPPPINPTLGGITIIREISLFFSFTNISLCYIFEFSETPREIDLLS